MVNKNDFETQLNYYIKLINSEMVEKNYEKISEYATIISKIAYTCSVIGQNTNNDAKNLRLKVEQLVEDFENSIGNRNMSDLEQGKYNGYRDILDLLDDLERGDINEQ